MEDIKNIKYLLRDINIVRKKYEEREKNEDNFNMFTILRKESDEVYLHSRFLSALLDPNGPHRLETTNLNLFLQEVNSKFKYDPNYLEVIPNNKNRAEYKNIDILFIDRRSKQAVIVENKIYHKDTNHETEGQLEKYYGSLIKEGIPEDNIEVYYLTLDGHAPSEDSVNLKGIYPKLKNKVVCISYSFEIINWLERVAREGYSMPSFRESVIQYIKVVRKMTNNNSTIEERKEITNIIGSDLNNVESFKLLVNNINHIRWHTIDSFWIELIGTLENEGFKILKKVTAKELSDLVHTNKKGKDAFLEIMVSYNDELKIRIKSDYSYGLHWGIYNTDIESETIVDRIKSLKGENDIYQKDKLWHLWKTFVFNINEKVHMREFDNDITYELILPQRRKEIIEGMKSEIMKFVKKFYE